MSLSDELELLCGVAAISLMLSCGRLCDGTSCFRHLILPPDGYWLEVAVFILSSIQTIKHFFTNKFNRKWVKKKVIYSGIRGCYPKALA